MKILYYDCFSGISGDMNLGALVDLGVDKDHLVNELSELSIKDEFELRISKDSKKGITGTRVEVVVRGGNAGHTHHHNRNLTDIEEIINSSGLGASVKKRSLAIFQKIAEAESTVHGKPIRDIHFHEVGAVDSIVDIVGAAICLDFLAVDEIISSPVELGGGVVRCEHGLLPVPAPATVEILTGIPVTSGAAVFEATTPTGAAILAAGAREFTPEKNFVIEKTGYGIGFKDGELPNVLRVFLANREEKAHCHEVTMAECNIDDMNPELYDYVMEKLFTAGALDVFLSPIIMKKGRPATMLSVLFNAKKEAAVIDILLRETTTLGIRKQTVKKHMLQKESVVVETSFGPVPVKHAFYNGEKIKSKPEYDICKKLALKHSVPIQNIYKEVYKQL
ncbi:MAG: nickel pincer cofactor biosynthesis protein LarC [bacterium]|nr:nickel pincer cofactor biosynthesis protein LarC [bacterium]